jgi:hypothetical protein
MALSYHELLGCYVLSGNAPISNSEWTGRVLRAYIARNATRRSAAHWKFRGLTSTGRWRPSPSPPRF